MSCLRCSQIGDLEITLAHYFSSNAFGNFNQLIALVSKYVVRFVITVVSND